jgi:hypothetical protein
MAGVNFDLLTREAEQKRIAELEARIERLRAVARKADVVLHDMTEGERDGLYGEELEAALYSLQPGDLEEVPDGAQE